MAPWNIQEAYGIPAGSAGNGKIVAIEDMPDSHALADVNMYRSAFNIPTLPACTGMPTGSLPACFAQVSETGGTPGHDGGESADGETSLDMDMISAACPDCSILLVTFPSSGPEDSDFIKAAKEAASLGAVATSISWGGPEEGDPSGSNYTTPGHLVLAATGDDGYDFCDDPGYPKTPSYPSSAPDVVAVGGTTLFYYSGPRYDEAVYSGDDRPLRRPRHHKRLQHGVRHAPLAGIGARRVGLQQTRDRRHRGSVVVQLQRRPDRHRLLRVGIRRRGLGVAGVRGDERGIADDRGHPDPPRSRRHRRRQHRERHVELDL